MFLNGQAQVQQKSKLQITGFDKPPRQNLEWKVAFWGLDCESSPFWVWDLNGNDYQVLPEEYRQLRLKLMMSLSNVGFSNCIEVLMKMAKYSISIGNQARSSVCRMQERNSHLLHKRGCIDTTHIFKLVLSLFIFWFLYSCSTKTLLNTPLIQDKLRTLGIAYPILYAIHICSRDLRPPPGHRTNLGSSSHIHSHRLHP